MNILVACEFSGIVRDAFRNEGHYALSADLRETEKPGPHYQGDVMDIIDEGWDLMVAHPPCTYLANSGVSWLYEDDERWKDLINAATFFRDLLQAEIPQIAVENPVMHKWGRKIVGRGADFSIQPWEFGHKEKKRTCFWTKRLPPLHPTKNVKNKMEKLPEHEQQKKHYLPPGEDRQKERSRFFEGVAKAMVHQWT